MARFFVLFLFLFSCGMPIQQPSPSITLTITPTLFYTDGSSVALNKIAYYNIYYGTASKNYTSMVTITNDMSNPLKVTLFLPQGKTYYLVATEIDVNGSGSESSYSAEVNKSI